MDFMFKDDRLGICVKLANVILVRTRAKHHTNYEWNRNVTHQLLFTLIFIGYFTLIEKLTFQILKTN